MNSKKNIARLNIKHFVFIIGILSLFFLIIYFFTQENSQRSQAEKCFDLHMHYHFCRNYKKAWEYIVKSTNLISTPKYLAYKAFYIDRGWGETKNSERASSIVYPLLASLEKSQDADCSFILGHIYKHGIGVKTDTQKMLYWYEKSFAYGSERGLRSIISFYLNHKDYAAAKKWCQEGLNHKVPEAMRQMGSIYFYGLGVPQNREKGLHYAKMAEKIFLERAKKQDILAITALFEMYFSIFADSDKGNLWLKEAVNSGSIPAIKKEISLATKDSGISKLDTNNLENATENDVVELMYQLAKTYEENKNYSQAMYWHKIACEHNHKKSSEYLQREYYQIGMRYEKGHSSTVKDLKEAKEWYKKAAFLGSEEANRKLNEWEKNGK